MKREHKKFIFALAGIQKRFFMGKGKPQKAPPEYTRRGLKFRQYFYRFFGSGSSSSISSKRRKAAETPSSLNYSTSAGFVSVITTSSSSTNSPGLISLLLITITSFDCDLLLNPFPAVKPFPAKICGLAGRERLIKIRETEGGKTYGSIDEKY